MSTSTRKRPRAQAESDYSLSPEYHDLYQKALHSYDDQMKKNQLDPIHPTEFNENLLLLQEYFHYNSSSSNSSALRPPPSSSMLVLELQEDQLRMEFLKFCIAYNQERLPLQFYQRSVSAVTTTTQSTECYNAYPTIVLGSMPTISKAAPRMQASSSSEVAKIHHPSWYTDVHSDRYQTAWRNILKRKKGDEEMDRVAKEVLFQTHFTDWHDLPMEESSGGGGRYAPKGSAANF